MERWLPFNAPEEEKKEIQEATASLTAAKATSVDATVVAVLSKAIKRITKNAFLRIMRVTTGYVTWPKPLLAPMGSLLWRYSCRDTAFCYLADRMFAQPTFKFCLFKKPSVCSSPDECEISPSDVGVFFFDKTAL